MSQRTDERTPKRVELETYDKILKLSAHVMSVCKPKENKPNNKHIPKRNASVGKMLLDCCVEMGCDVLEANTIYVGANLNRAERIQNYLDRIELQTHARRLTFRMEHIFRMLFQDNPFAESTTKYMLELICEVRGLLTAWRDADIKVSRSL